MWRSREKGLKVWCHHCIRDSETWWAEPSGGNKGVRLSRTKCLPETTGRALVEEPEERRGTEWKRQAARAVSREAVLPGDAERWTARGGPAAGTH